MKKLFSISFAFLILLSGVNLSIATHFCGGEVAAVKWSLSGENATCGMEDSDQTSPVGINSNCCHNLVVFYTVDNNYSPSSLQINEVTKTLSQVFYIPVNISFHSFIPSASFSNNALPPGNLLTSNVSRAHICIFRI
jgi:hypothetical protein